jgi:hypothetical protein
MFAVNGGLVFLVAAFEVAVGATFWKARQSPDAMQRVDKATFGRDAFFALTLTAVMGYGLAFYLTFPGLIVLSPVLELRSRHCTSILFPTLLSLPVRPLLSRHIVMPTHVKRSRNCHGCHLWIAV